MSDNSPHDFSQHDFREALLNRRMLICIFTGFSSGLPLFILLNLLPAWMRTEGVDLKVIGLTSLFSLPYTWKFLWAPFMDRFALPLLGRRRGWMLLSQLAVFASVAALGLFSPKTDLDTISLLCIVMAFFSASQDIVLDAYRRELLPDNELGLGNTIHVNAYKIAGLVPGSLSLILADHLPWDLVFLITASFMFLGVMMTLLVAEPRLTVAPPKTLQEAVVEPLKEFWNRDGGQQALLILGFIFLYKLGDSMATALATPFYMDMGYTKTQIGLIAKNAGLWSSVAGGLLGGVWMIRLGINRSLWLFGVVQLLAILGFAWLAATPEKTLLSLGIVIGAEAFGVGLGTAAFVAYIAQQTDPRYTATQFALFTSLAALPRTVFNSATGWMAETLGWPTFFLCCTALAVPGLLLLMRVAPWSESHDTRA